jgi:hypothetical protein
LNPHHHQVSYHYCHLVVVVAVTAVASLLVATTVIAITLIVITARVRVGVILATVELDPVIEQVAIGQAGFLVEVVAVVMQP